LTVEKLADMNPDEFKNFADGVGLDTLSRKRFIKSIGTVKA